jgi:hypothetical protein
MHQQPPFRSSEKPGLVVFTPVSFGSLVNSLTKEFKARI